VKFAKVAIRDAHTESRLTPVLGGVSRGVGRLVENGENKALVLPSVDAQRLGVRAGQLVAYWATDEGHRIGPYIGIMTNKRPGGRPGFEGLRGRRETYRGLLKMAKSMGAVAYVFACEDVNFKKMRVVGYSRDATGRWVSREYPLPNVVYNRVPDRRSEVSPLVRMAKKRFEQLSHTHRIALFNPHFLNKWDLHRLLSRDSELAQYLPDTRVYSKAEDVLEMLKRYRMVYLKPRDTFAGRGIMRAEYKGGRYILSHKVGSVYRHDGNADFASLAQNFAAKRIPGVYLVQQGLRLAKYKGAIFDARIIAQKDERGRWGLTGVGVRVAARGGITTHVPNGGYIAPIEAILRDVFNEDCDTPNGVYSRVRSLAMKVAPAIEHRYNRLFGEMSMDIGITQDGECFFFEANAKPMKFDEPNIRRKSLTRLVEFCRHLAGYEAESYDNN